MRVDDAERRVARERIFLERLERGERKELGRLRTDLNDTRVELQRVKKRFSDVIHHLRREMSQPPVGSSTAKLLETFGRSLPETITQVRRAGLQERSLLTRQELVAQRLSTIEGALAKNATKSIEGNERRGLVQEEVEREEVIEARFTPHGAVDSRAALEPASSMPTLERGVMPVVTQHLSLPVRHEARTEEPPQRTHEAPVQIDAHWRRGAEEGMRVTTELRGETLHLVVSDEERRRIGVELEPETLATASRLRRQRRALETMLRAAGLEARVEIR